MGQEKIKVCDASQLSYPNGETTCGSAQIEGEWYISNATKKVAFKLEDQQCSDYSIFLWLSHNSTNQSSFPFGYHSFILSP